MAFLEDPRFPDLIDFGFAGGPEFQTVIHTSACGAELRHRGLQQARRRWSPTATHLKPAELAQIETFFLVLGGRAHGFRFRDPADHSTAPDGVGLPSPTDQPIAVGDGHTYRFRLAKTYALGGFSHHRLLTKPEAGSVLCAVDGIAIPHGALLVDASSGWIELANPPEAGARLTAGCRFDVPVRFDTDRMVRRRDSASAAQASFALIELIGAEAGL